MTSRDFCYWLQGYFELASTNVGQLSITSDQLKMIQKHLNLVFIHEIDPSMGDKDQQNKLNSIHGKPGLEGVARC